MNEKRLLKKVKKALNNKSHYICLTKYYNDYCVGKKKITIKFSLYVKQTENTEGIIFNGLSVKDCYKQFVKEFIGK